MAHYAVLDDNNVVTNVFVGVDENSDLPEGYTSWEEWYTNRKGQTVKRCSYNTIKGVHKNGGIPFRGNYPGSSDTYDPEQDLFIPYKEWDSWVWNGTTYEWEAPIAKPETNPDHYEWNEEAYQADNTTGWVLAPEYR